MIQTSTLSHCSWSDFPTRHWKATDMSGVLDRGGERNQSEALKQRWGQGAMAYFLQIKPQQHKKKNFSLDTFVWGGRRVILALWVHPLTLSTCSRFSSLSWSWFLSHRAKSLSCVTAPRVSLSLAYSDFTCTEQRELEEILVSSVDVELFPPPSHKRGCLEGFSDD